MNTADALAGPPELGRSVLIGPGDAVPGAWSGCERVRVSLSGISAATGRRLREAWLGRNRLVIELDGEFPEPSPVWQSPWWELSPGMTMRSEVLAHLITANAIDARQPGQARFAPVEAALRLGAVPASGSSTPAESGGDVVTEAGPVWCDGGPLEAFELPAPVVPAANLAAGSLRGVQPAEPRADLASDQHAAVGHLGGAACIVAPAGSGKTRVLTERARYLVRDLGVAAGAVCLVAFNVRARREMEERTRDLTGLQVRTLNSIALAVCNGTGPFVRPAGRSRVEVIDEMGVRDRLDGLVKRRRRAMTDQLAPWLEALSASRLGLRDPVAVEGDFQPDVPEFSTLAPRYVKDLSADGLVDFDQQIIGAIEILLADPAARAAARRACGALLVDEFQDLTPAHLLMIRLLAGPRADVFAVGDDDQTIYGYAGASPQWLIDFDKYFPGAARHHLNVNYRCPPPVVRAAVNLLSHNHRRIDKQITAPAESVSDAVELSADDSASTTMPDAGHDSGPSAAANCDETALAVRTGPEAATALRETVAALIDGGVRPSDIAVLTRVNSTLLVPQIVLGEMGVAADAPLGRGFMERTGVAGALAWLRLAVAPRHALPGGALSDAARRPPRGISPRVIEWIGEQRSLGALRALAGRLSDDRTATKIDEYADDIDMLRQRTANEQLSTEAILEIVRDELGLGYSLDTRLDASRRSVDRSAHGDDLRALISVAHLHPDPAGFAAWLADRLSGFGDSDTAGFGNDEARSSSNGAAVRSAHSAQRSGVRLATVHRVKGLEWPHVIVYEASAGLMPHRLAHDIEEERRVFHVALTRCAASVTFISDDPPSPFLAELSQLAPPLPAEPEPVHFGGTSPESRGGTASGAGAGSGSRADPDDTAVLPGTGSRPAARRPKPEPPTDPSDAALFEALRTWRLERSRAEGVRAFRVFSDAVLIELATRRPSNDAELLAVHGIGPAKRDSYGAEVLALIAQHA
ncbi:ATP-dependent DNA helicase UvrD2 [Candidatus Poriferisodalis sp.]|uniref:ATP-dependent DNA helicase UvrD2 n=1 Tax=Candidatus Poriferisodalis sp. TaxID=3101277 RepID=UPI003B023D31